MKILLVVLILISAAMVYAEPKIEVMYELAKQVNAYTQHNQIPWYKAIKEDVQTTVICRLGNIIPLVQTTHGDFNHTLYRVRFHVVKVLDGNLDSEELTFFLERKFPTPESGIKLKELWPFHSGVVLVFKGIAESGKFKIVSIEKETQP